MSWSVCISTEQLQAKWSWGISSERKQVELLPVFTVALRAHCTATTQHVNR